MSQIGEVIYSLPQEIALSGNTDNLEFLSSYVHLTPSANLDLTGFQSPISDDHILILVVENESSTDTITLKHNNSSSSVGNRISTPTGLDVPLLPGQYAQFRRAGNFFWLQSVWG